jgi:hypothetical protein
MSFGPMQLLVVGFDDAEPNERIAAELRRLREHDIVRLVDLLVVTKAPDGTVTALETSDLSDGDAVRLGAFAGALVGLGAAGEEGAELGALAGAEAAEGGASPLQGEVWFVADAIPAGTRAAIAILEHRWAIPLRDAIEQGGGQGLADAWIHPADLVGLGHHLSEDGAPSPA